MFACFRERLRDRGALPPGVKERFESFEQTFCSKPDPEAEGNALLAKTQFLDVVFLPTLVVMLSPPLQMLEDKDEKANMLAWVPKPTAAYKVFRMIQMMEYVEVGAVNRGLITDEDEDGPPPRIFTTPDFTLEMRRGDHIGHVLLLASLFLGMREETFILIGTARKTNEAGADEESWHIWVMTREPNNDDCAREPYDKIADAKARSRALNSPNGCFSLSKEDQENIAELHTPKKDAGDEKGKRVQSGAVKFWEVTRSTYYLLPNRWAGCDREKRLNIARFGRDKGDAGDDGDKGDTGLESKAVCFEGC